MLKGPGTKECHSSSMTRKELIKKNKAIADCCLNRVQEVQEAVLHWEQSGSSGFMASTKVVVHVGGVPLTLAWSQQQPSAGMGYAWVCTTTVAQLCAVSATIAV